MFWYQMDDRHDVTEPIRLATVLYCTYTRTGFIWTMMIIIIARETSKCHVYEIITVFISTSIFDTLKISSISGVKKKQELNCETPRNKNH